MLANIAIDLAGRPGPAEVAARAHCSLICPPEEARKRLKRVMDRGFDEMLSISHSDAIEDIERAQDWV